VVLNERHLRKLLKKYLVYYHESRTQLGLAKDAPELRPVMAQGEIIAIPQVGGLHHRYERREVVDGYAQPIGHRSKAKAALPGLAPLRRSD
jgi:hypothetical protein